MLLCFKLCIHRFFLVCTQLVGCRCSFLIRKWQDSNTLFSAFLFFKKSVILPKELQTKMRQIEGKHVVTNNVWIISFKMLSNDFENFAGKTQTFCVKQNPSDNISLCVHLHFVLFLSLLYCVCCKESIKLFWYFIQAENFHKIQCISVLKLSLFS